MVFALAQDAKPRCVHGTRGSAGTVHQGAGRDLSGSESHSAGAGGLRGLPCFWGRYFKSSKETRGQVGSGAQRCLGTSPLESQCEGVSRCHQQCQKMTGTARQSLAGRTTQGQRCSGPVLSFSCPKPCQPGRGRQGGQRRYRAWGAHLCLRVRRRQPQPQQTAGEGK